MPAMPNLYGLNLQEAEQALMLAGVLNTSALGYFGTWPITVQWVSADGAIPFIFTANSSITADSSITVDDFLLPFLTNPGTVVNQSIGTGDTAAVNAPVKLTVIQYPMGVSYP